MAVMIDPGDEILTIYEWVVMYHEAPREAAYVHFDAVFSGCRQQLRNGVAAVRYQFHGFAFLRSCMLKSIVRRINLRLAAQFTFQCDTPCARSPNRTGKRPTESPRL